MVDLMEKPFSQGRSSHGKCALTKQEDLEAPTLSGLVGQAMEVIIQPGWSLVPSASVLPLFLFTLSHTYNLGVTFIGSC